MALFSLSRSEINSVRICSVFICRNNSTLADYSVTYQARLLLALMGSASFCLFRDTWLFSRERSPDSLPKRRQVAYDRSPDCLKIDVIVLVTKPIPDTANVAPGQARTQCFRLIAKPRCSFANDEQLPFNSCNCLSVSLERFEVHAGREGSNRRDCLQYVLKRERRFSKRQARPRPLL